MRILMLATAACCFATFRELLAQTVDTKGIGLENMSAVDKERLTKLFPRTNITRLSGKLQKMRLKSIDRLKLDSKTQKELEQLMKNYRQKPNVNHGETNSIQEINSKAGITEVMYQGDIMLTDDQIDSITNEESSGNRAKRQSATIDAIWGSTVYYYFDGSASATVRDVFIKATKTYSANSCINFLESTTAPNRIRVWMGSGCNAAVGMSGGVQNLSLGIGCEFDMVGLHELGHALGFWHTHQRFDRDDYITVNVNNLQNKGDYDKHSSAQTNTYGLGYDYGSVMHNAPLTASSNGQPVLVAKDPKYQETMGSSQVSFTEYSMLNELYQCKGKCGAAAAACWNGGFPNPKSCGVCICPSGYGGALCNQRPPGCGSSLTATASFQTLIDNSGDGRPRSEDGFMRCNYMIQAPSGKRVEVRLKSFTDKQNWEGCVANGVEIKTQSDQKLTGYRFCSNKSVGVSLISTRDLVPIIAYSGYTVIAELEYRFVDAPMPPCVETNTKNLWGCAVYYYFDVSASAAVREVFLKAAEIWSTSSCISFQESSTAANRIRVQKGSGICTSDVGKIGGVQNMSFGEGCEKLEVALHLTGIVLGLTHTHRRLDRDNYITVIDKNIAPAYMVNFIKEYNGGMPYDYGSVMHFSQFTFNQYINEPTIIAKDSQYKYTMGSGQVSFYDFSMLNDLYQCKGKCGANACWNGGFPNPKNCGVCVCPTGYGGALCNMRPPGCGTTMTSTSSFQTFVDNTGDGRPKSADGFYRCNHWIEAPAGKRIEVRIKSYSAGRTIGCASYAVEIKAQADQKRTGYRFCAREDAGVTLLSAYNYVPWVTYSLYADTKAELEYRYVDAPLPCEDTSANCASWVNNGFCSNTFYTMEQKKSYCGRSCSLC